jgi:hypothetical protein
VEVFVAIPRFEIFRGVYADKDVLWVESLKSLAEACFRMEALAADNPGPYFVFKMSSREIVAVVDTTGSF